MFSLVDTNNLNEAKLLIQGNEVLKKELIQTLASGANAKVAAKLIKDFKYDEDEYPEVKERLLKATSRYYVNRYLFKPKNPTE